MRAVPKHIAINRFEDFLLMCFTGQRLRATASLSQKGNQWGNLGDRKCERSVLALQLKLQNDVAAVGLLDGADDAANFIDWIACHH